MPDTRAAAPVVSTVELARRLNVNVETVRRWARSGKLPRRRAPTACATPGPPRRCPKT